MDFGSECGIVLRHSLAHAAELHRRCIVNREQMKYVAQSLGLPKKQVAGTVRLLRSLGYIPSPERCALVVMNDWGMEDEDIAEIFGRTKRWAEAVRSNAAELREAEPIWRHLEYVDEGLRPQDPCPEELYRRAAEIRAKREDQRDAVLRYAPTQGGMRQFAWNGRYASFVSICTRWRARG